VGRRVRVSRLTASRYGLPTALGWDI